ncbi:MAG: hypothetical protein ACRDD7_17040 [Peptostreptococcaceae bacterium]
MDIDLIFKIVIAIVGIGLCIKIFKFIGSIVFKIALVAFIILLIYQIFL